MLPALLVVGIGALIGSLFFEDEHKRRKRTSRSNNKSKKIFISFAIEDKKYRDFLVSQAKNERSPFSFVDMSVKQPWTERIWKEKCRQKIQQCDGMIVLLSKNTWHSDGLRWETKCAREEMIPVVGMHINKYNKGAVPPEIRGERIIEWTWDNLEYSIKKF